MNNKLYGSNSLKLINVILMYVMMGIGAFAPCHRYHPYLRLFLALASTLFLPIVSKVAATIHGDAYFTSVYVPKYYNMVIAGTCQMTVHVILVFLWTTIVVTIGVNTSITVVGDAREGRNAEPPAELLVKAARVLYLALTVFVLSSFFSTARHIRIRDVQFYKDKTLVALLLVSLNALVFLPFLKMVLKYAACSMARGLAVFGRNPRLIARHNMDLLGEAP
jgi:hypothetical protein